MGSTMIYAYWALALFAVSFLASLIIAAAIDSNDPERDE